MCRRVCLSLTFAMVYALSCFATNPGDGDDGAPRRPDVSVVVLSSKVNTRAYTLVDLFDDETDIRALDKSYLEGEKSDTALRSFVALDKWCEGWRPEGVCARDVLCAVRFIADGKYTSLRDLVGEDEVQTMRRRLLARKDLSTNAYDVVRAVNAAAFHRRSISASDETLALDLFRVRGVLYRYLAPVEGL